VALIVKATAIAQHRQHERRVLTATDRDQRTGGASRSDADVGRSSV
jgi:hypothetical protein